LKYTTLDGKITLKHALKKYWWKIMDAIVKEYFPERCWCEHCNEISGHGKCGERHRSILIGPTTENPLTVTCESLFVKINII
jgi:hypothetical protein